MALKVNNFIKIIIKRQIITVIVLFTCSLSKEGINYLNKDCKLNKIQVNMLKVTHLYLKVEKDIFSLWLSETKPSAEMWFSIINIT